MILKIKKIQFRPEAKFGGNIAYTSLDLTRPPQSNLCTASWDSEERMLRVAFLAGPLKGEIFAVPVECCGPMQFDLPAKKAA